MSNDWWHAPLRSRRPFNPIRSREGKANKIKMTLVQDKKSSMKSKPTKWTRSKRPCSNSTGLDAKTRIAGEEVTVDATDVVPLSGDKFPKPAYLGCYYHGRDGLQSHELQATNHLWKAFIVWNFWPGLTNSWIYNSAHSHPLHSHITPTIKQQQNRFD